MPCRIAFVVGQLVAGGLERQLFYLLSGMDRELYQPAVFVWNYSEDDPFVAPIRSLGVPLHPVSGSSPIDKTQALRELLRDTRPEIAHSYSTFTNFSTWLACRGLSTIPVGSIRNVFELARRHGGWRGLLNCRFPRSQIFNSRTAVDSAKDTGGWFRPAKILPVYNGMDLTPFHVVPLAEDEIPSLLGIGSLLAKKRWDRLLRVCARLRDDGIPFRLQLVGVGPLRGELEASVGELNLVEQVSFLGQRSDINELLGAASALVLTSEIEGTPNVVMEAMACGRPVVAMDAGDVSRLVVHGETGYVCPNGDERQFADYLRQVLADHGLRASMGESARRVAEREFGLPQFVANTLDAYRQAGWSG